MKTIRYLRAAQADLKRHGYVAGRLRKALLDYAADPAAHANNVIPLVGRPGRRMRVGDYRIIFEETETELLVTRIGPRGSVYD